MPNPLIRMIVLILLLVTPNASWANVADMVRLARLKGERCDLDGALAGFRQALRVAPTEWAPETSGFMIIHHDLATYANKKLDYRQAQISASEALSLAKKRDDQGQQSALEQAILSQNLAVALAGLGRRAEASELFGRIMPMLTTSSDSATAANAELIYSDFEFNVGHFESGQDHIRKAAALIRRSAAIEPRLKVQILLRFADARRRVLDFDGATSALAEAATAQRAISGKADTPRLALVRASIALERGTLADALAQLDAIEKANPPFDPCDPTLMVDVNQQRANIHLVRRDLPEASAALTRALAMLSRLRLGDNAREGEIIFSLAVVASMSRDFEQSSELFDSAIKAYRRVYGGASEAEAQTLLEKAVMLGEAGRAREGVEAAQAALAILEGTAGRSSLMADYARAAYGLALFKAGDFAAAETELSGALDAFHRARGAGSFDLAPGLRGLGEIAMKSGDAGRAENYFRRAIAIQRAWGGDSAVSLGVSLSHLAQAHAAQGAQAQALLDSAEAVDILRKRMAIGEARPWNDAAAERIAARSILTQDLALVSADATPGKPIIDAGAAERMFHAGQLANAASTGGAIAQMATRIQVTDPSLSALLSSRNDLSAEWRAIQQDLIGSLAQPVFGDDARQGALLDRQVDIARQLDAIDGRLAAGDPKLGLLIKSRTVSLDELQARLRPDEALLSIIVADGASYVVAVRRDGIMAFRAALGQAEADARVKRLRDAVDRAHWPSGMKVGGPGWVDKLPRYDTESAYALFSALISPAEDFLAGTRTLLVVPDGALGSIPFTMLLTAPAANSRGTSDDYRGLPWLVRRYAVVNYPSVASIVALRTLSRDAPVHTTMFGVGNANFSSGGAGRTRAGLLRGLPGTRMANPQQLHRLLGKLPDTKTELQALAKAFGPADAQLLLGRKATEASVRAAPLEGFGVIVFATHALVAGELSGYAEPALALTPPKKATEMDDGLLSASEIATLRIRADWVILSACNTAAGDGSPRAEPLSGLAKSFFYAGARSLLVSHWPVYSPAAAKLTVATVQHAAGDNFAPQALRAAQLDVIDGRAGSHWSHPLFWAPFSLIGG